MQIICENCNKTFNLDQNLIPKEGRYLQCGTCNYKWFYKSVTIKKKIIDENLEEQKKNVDVNELKINKKKDLKSNTLKKVTKKKEKKN